MSSHSSSEQFSKQNTISHLFFWALVGVCFFFSHQTYLQFDTSSLEIGLSCHCYSYYCLDQSYHISSEKRKCNCNVVASTILLKAITKVI